PIAAAFATLVEDLFGGRVKVNYSSRKELEGGIAPGEEWFRWIVNQVRGSDIAFILVTPASIQKPWVIWEAGAVAGAAFAAEEQKVRVIPITIGIKSSEIPSPFALTQLVNGTEESDVNKLVEELFERFKAELAPKEMRNVGVRQTAAVRSCIEDVKTALLKLPLTITEAAVQEWLGRLDDLQKAG